jgi:hypothetical protein
MELRSKVSFPLENPLPSKSCNEFIGHTVAALATGLNTYGDGRLGDGRHGGGIEACIARRFAVCGFEPIGEREVYNTAGSFPIEDDIGDLSTNVAHTASINL